MKLAASIVVSVVVVVAACGGTQQPAPSDPPLANTGNGDPVGAPKRSALEQRRDAACKQIGPKLTACAVEDAKADLANGTVKQAQFDQDTSQGVQRKNTEKFIEECTNQPGMSSRQVRVLEVCFREEAECGPLRECLKHLQPEK